MASKETWAYYHSPGIVKTDAELVSMIQDVVDTIHNLERMYGVERAQLMVRAIMMDWHALSLMAFHRGIEHYAHPVVLSKQTPEHEHHGVVYEPDDEGNPQLS